jgi:hypothetical protein
MENEKILKLFKKFIGVELKLNGLIAVPIKAEQSIDGILNEYPLLTDLYGITSSYYDTKFVN